MMMRRSLFLLVVLWCALVRADSYLHNPRGSNNRLNERSANRRNGNRLFDSQNNNRGGYNVGDRTSNAFDEDEPLGKANGVHLGPNQDTNNLNLYDVSGIFAVGKDMTTGQYPLVHMEGSELPVEYTVQHGCGGTEEGDPHKLNCNILLQYMCNTDDDMTSSPYRPDVAGADWSDGYTLNAVRQRTGSGQPTNRAYIDPTLAVRLRDGGNTNTPEDPNGENNVNTVEADNLDDNRGRQESEAYYHDCETRQRNKGLFTADQNLRGQSAKYTRQNPHGTRRGLECPEERDYWPYWHPSPWRDIVNLSDDKERCELHAEQSMNVVKKYKCISASSDSPYKQQCTSKATEEQCVAQKTEQDDPICLWQGYTHGIAKPECAQAPWARVNHLGNGRDGQPNRYNWTLPTIDELENSGVLMYQDSGVKFAACTFRLRYNISTDDYDPWLTDSSSNQNRNQGILSPVQQNPTVPTGAGPGGLQGLRLAINTAQFGRTFQDRSHVFFIKQRPAGVNQNANIVNLNVRGKRGNIVQTFPAVEYDFIPNNVVVNQGDFLHLQWTGSNTHNNGNPAGDGQAGDAGEGRGGTDRHNFAALLEDGDNFFAPLDTGLCTVWDALECLDAWTGRVINAEVCKMALISSGHLPATDSISKISEQMTEAYTNNGNDPVPFVGPLLDDSPASLPRGVLLKMKKPNCECPEGSKSPEGDCVFRYGATRNNNFSNRSQKGRIVIKGAAQ